MNHHYVLWIFLRDLAWGKSLGRARQALVNSIVAVSLLGGVAVWAQPRFEASLYPVPVPAFVLDAEALIPGLDVTNVRVTEKALVVVIKVASIPPGLTVERAAEFARMIATPYFGKGVTQLYFTLIRLVDGRWVFTSVNIVSINDLFDEAPDSYENLALPNQPVPQEDLRWKN